MKTRKETESEKNYRVLCSYIEDLFPCLECHSVFENLDKAKKELSFLRNEFLHESKNNKRTSNS